MRVPILPRYQLWDQEIGRVDATSVLLARKGGRLYAYANVCRHLPLTLDLGDGEVATPDGDTFLCHHHGARYRVEDGTCEWGPCDGQSLVPIDLEILDGEVVLVLPAG